MSVLVLSNNVIFTIMDNAFQNLTVLRTLLMDHNRITSQSLDRSTFSWLSKLEILQLGNNALRVIDGSWFQNSKALKALFLEGNLLTSLNSTSFGSSDLRNLETLGLSDNLITYVGQDSFHNLPRLRSLDLSRNRLQNAPNAFSYLSWLSLLNLDLNRWNCTCELRELASFLNSYIQSPSKVLYNGQRMICERSDNPAIWTVLELTEANCAPANSNISVQVVAKGSSTPQHYIRDVAITAACSFLGGVGIMLGVLALVYRKLNKRITCWQVKTATEGQAAQATAQWDYSEDKEALSMCYALHNSNYKDHQPWNKDVSYDIPVNNQFICRNCCSANLETGYQESRWRRKTLLQRSNQMGIQHNRKDDWSSHAKSDQLKDTASLSRIKDVQRFTEKDDSNTYHFQTQENDPQHGVSQDLPTMRIQQSAFRRHLSVAQSQTFTPKEQMHNNMEVHGNHVNNHSAFKHQLKEYGTLPVYQTINCLHCHQTYEYRQAVNKDQDIIFRKHKEGMLPRGDQISEAIQYKNPLNSNIDLQGEGQAREQRNVTFALSGPMNNALIVPSKTPDRPSRINSIKTCRKLEQKGHPRQGKASDNVNRISTHRYGKSHKSRSQSNRKLKVKLNLNPLRKSQVYPKSSSSHGNYDTDTVKKDKLATSKVKKDGSSQLKQKSKDKTTKKSTHNGSKPKKSESSKQSQENHQGSSFIPENNSDDNKENSNDHCEAAVNESIFPGATNTTTTMEESTSQQEGGDLSNNSMTPLTSGPAVIQEYLSSGDGSPKRRIRLIIPEKTSSRPQTALQKKIR
ncbi:uncharacterized protein lrrc53 [Electrophorus electricus]|uniref:uncharacterized protein lrrc53 n=1 Tax=Electrophorus electricus TaxID=8005 RepID=UPI0015D05466|nr:uncharacterized protein lrrc53 [Electrophorus electricus]